MSSRRRLLRWAGWFAAANAALLAIIGLRYLWLYVHLSPSVAWGYAALAYVGHVSALAYLPCLLVLMPVILLSPRPRLVVPLGVVLSSIGGSLLLLDSLVFAENRYHLSILTFILLAPQTWSFLGLLRRGGRGDRGDAGGLGLAAHRAAPGEPHGAIPGAGPGGLLRGRSPDPRVGRGALRRAGDLVHPVPAALRTAEGHHAAGEAGPRGSGAGAGARRHRRPRRNAGGRAALPAGAPAVRAPRAAAQRAARGDRRDAGGCAHGRRGAAARRILTRRDPVRPALQWR